MAAVAVKRASIVLAAGHAAYLAYVALHTIGRDDPLVPVGGKLPGETPIIGTLGYLVVVWAWRHVAKVARVPEELVAAAMSVYNVYLTILSAIMFVLLAVTTLGAGQHVWALQVDRSATGSLLAWTLWVNYNSKYLEYLDTAFMLARGKLEQVSVLHWSHHAVMPGIMWLTTSDAPGGSSYFGPMLNSLVHTVMYAYYGGMLPSSFPKQAVTQMQLLQFFAIVGHAVYHIMRPNQYWPLHLAWTELALMGQMISLFLNFYINAYAKKKSSKAKAAAGAGASADKPKST